LVILRAGTRLSRKPDIGRMKLKLGEGDELAMHRALKIPAYHPLVTHAWEVPEEF
jgi:hypothetical protein